MKKFSIIIPTLNEENYLPLLLEDLLAQNHQDFHTLVVDAHSEDQTQKVALTYKKQLNLEVLNSQKRNVAYQRNLGAQNAQSEYLVFLDADSRINPDFLSNLAKEIAQSAHLIYLPALRSQDNSFQNKLLFSILNILINLSQKTPRPFSSSGSMIWQKEFFHTLGGFNEIVFTAEDHEIVQRARRLGIKAKFLTQTGVKYSLRRVKKEGKFKLLKKYLKSSLHTLRKGKINEKIFDYEMGGHYHTPPKKKLENK